MGCKLGTHDTRHGMSRSRLYRIWASMKDRCRDGVSNPAAQKYYVDRGVGFCPEWVAFEPFAKWALANGYADHLTIDRINSDGNYEPSNCQWLSMSANVRKRRGLKLSVEVAREIRSRRMSGESAATLAAEFGVNATTVYRIASGDRWAESAA